MVVGVPEEHLKEMLGNSQNRILLTLLIMQVSLRYSAYITILTLLKIRVAYVHAILLTLLHLLTIRYTVYGPWGRRVLLNKAFNSDKFVAY